jgi:hypothetical protein
MIGQSTAPTLQKHEHLVDPAVAAPTEPRVIHLRGQIVVIEYKTFAEQLVECPNKHKGVGGIVRMYNVEIFTNKQIKREDKCRHHRIAVFPHITQKAISA